MSDYPQPSPYGASPSPYDGSGGYGAPAPVSDKRPGTVTAAAITTIVLSAIVAIGVAISLIGFSGARDDIVAEIDDTAGMQDIDTGQLLDVITIALVVVLVWTIAAIVLAVLAMRRSSVARILLVVSSVLTVLVSLVAILSIVSVVPLIAAVAVIVLLFTGGAGDWYARRPGATGPPPTALG